MRELGFAVIGAMALVAFGIFALRSPASDDSFAATASPAVSGADLFQPSSGRATGTLND